MTGATVIDTPQGIEMFGWLQFRSRLHMEIKTGLPFSSRGPSTLEILRHRGITESRSRWIALCDLNRYIAAIGGPSDRQSLALQRWLASQGKPYALPALPETLELAGKP